MAELRENAAGNPSPTTARVRQPRWAWAGLAIPVLALGLAAVLSSPDRSPEHAVAARPQVEREAPSMAFGGDGEQVVRSAGWHPAIAIGLGPIGPAPGDRLGEPARRVAR